MTKQQRSVAFFVGLFWVLLVVTVLRSSVIEPYRIPTPSMVPTLMVGDHIFVNKFAYGFKVPWPISDGGIIEEKKWIVTRSGPERGDVIVFAYPRDVSINFIKRVIGRPGDKISLKDNVLYINGEVQEQFDLADAEKVTDLKRFFVDPNLVSIKEEKLGEKRHLVGFDQVGGSPIHATYPHEEPELVIPEHHYFVMGDNRNNSSDSRFWGFVPEENIKGRAVVVWFSLHLDFGTDVFNPAGWKVVFNPKRIGTIVR